MSERQPSTYPPWCEKPRGHDVDPSDHDHLATVLSTRLAPIDQVRGPATKPLRVEVRQFVTDVSPYVYPPLVRISLDDTGVSYDEEEVTAVEARQLANALRDAADLLDASGGATPNQGD